MAGHAQRASVLALITAVGCHPKAPPTAPQPEVRTEVAPDHGANDDKCNSNIQHAEMSWEGITPYPGAEHRVSILFEEHCHCFQGCSREHAFDAKDPPSTVAAFYGAAPHPDAKLKSQFVLDLPDGKRSVFIRPAVLNERGPTVLMISVGIPCPISAH